MSMIQEHRLKFEFRLYPGPDVHQPSIVAGGPSSALSFRPLAPRWLIFEYVGFCKTKSAPWFDSGCYCESRTRCFTGTPRYLILIPKNFALSDIYPPPVAHPIYTQKERHHFKSHDQSVLAYKNAFFDIYPSSIISGASVLGEKTTSVALP